MLIELKKLHPDINGFLFVIKAMTKNYDQRIHMTHILISNGFAYGTDGSRLHRCRLEEKYTPGLYRVFKALKRHLILYKTEKKKSDFPKIMDILTINKIPIIKHISFDQQFPSSYAKIIRAIDENLQLIQNL